MNTALIHSDASTSEQLLMISDSAALLFLLGMTHCDDYGRIKASPAHWTLKVCPGRHVLAKVKELLGELESAKDASGVGLVEVYEVEGERFYRVPKWFSRQGFRHDYVLIAKCPHPILGVVEPPVSAKTLRDFYGKDLEQHNQNAEAAAAFLDQGEKSRASRFGSRDSKPKPRDDNNQSREIADESRDLGQESRDDTAGTNPAPNNQSREIADESRDLGQESRVLGLPPASASASASSPAPASPSLEGGDKPRAHEAGVAATAAGGSLTSLTPPDAVPKPAGKAKRGTGPRAEDAARAAMNRVDPGPNLRVVRGKPADKPPSPSQEAELAAAAQAAAMRAKVSAAEVELAAWKDRPNGMTREQFAAHFAKEHPAQAAVLAEQAAMLVPR